MPRVQMQADLLGGQGMPPAMGNPLYQSPPPQAQLVRDRIFKRVQCRSRWRIEC